MMVLPSHRFHFVVALAVSCELASFVHAKRLDMKLGGATIGHHFLGLPVKENDQLKCKSVSIHLIQRIGQGQWGVVFLAHDINKKNQKYAVKVQTRKAPVDEPNMEPKHEARIMQYIDRYVKVPKVIDFCEVQGWQILVMELVEDAIQLSDGFDESQYDMKSVAKHVYTYVTNMLLRKVTNVDQVDKNILVNPKSQVFFIDMGMAETEAETMQMCNDPSRRNNYKAITDLADLGIEAGCDSQIGQLRTGTLAAALDAIPSWNQAAMQGLTDAFCAKPNKALTSNEYFKVSAGVQDTSFRAAFIRKQKYDGSMVEPILVKHQGGWIKVDDRDIKSTPKYREESHKIPKGAKLIAYKCDDNSQDLAQFDPVNYKGAICAGSYYFKLSGFQYVRDKVAEIVGQLPC